MLAVNNKVLPKICLSMIVKDEITVLPKLFKSLIGFIDVYAIVDTGSTDGTQLFIKTFMDKVNIPGSLIEEPWVNFGHNRQQALDLAKTTNCNYVFFIDADEELIIDTNKINLIKQELTSDCYKVMKSLNGINYYLPMLVKVDNPDVIWEWHMPVHEYLQSRNISKDKKPVHVTTVTQDLFYVKSYTGVSARSKTDRFASDRKLLEDFIKNNEQTLNNEVRFPKQVKPSEIDVDRSKFVHHKISRATFYLAQTYRDSSLTKLAKQTYSKRITQAGWDQELFYSYYMLVRFSLDEDLISDALAYSGFAEEISPNRFPEIALLFTAYYRKIKEWKKIKFYCEKALKISEKPQDDLFIDHQAYTWKIKDELSIALYYLGEFDLALKTYRELLPDAPKNHMPRILKNYNFTLTKLYL